ncbi:hypothetical protein L9F63_017363, partial [Diploptera punctata]
LIPSLARLRWKCENQVTGRCFNMASSLRQIFTIVQCYRIVMSFYMCMKFCCQ